MLSICCLPADAAGEPGGPLYYKEVLTRFYLEIFYPHETRNANVTGPSGIRGILWVVQSIDLWLNETGFEVHGSEETRGYFPVPVAGLIPTWLKRDMLHGYLACVSWVDHLIGRIVDEADSLGITNHTATVLWSDHGFHLGGEGDHGMWGKRSPLENSLRVPLIFVPPGGSGSAVKRVDAPVELLDIFPTLCEMSDLPIPSRVQGRSLVPLIASTASATGGEGAITMLETFRHCHGTCPYYSGERAWGYSYRTSRYRLTRWVSPGFESARRVQGSVDLFDLEADPGETKNLATSNNALVAELSAKLLAKCQECPALHRAQDLEFLETEHGAAELYRETVCGVFAA
ncbi:hypothetical protein EMIHUDRAFT_250748 [Emiliania huxleyi CCMP1516]|uniref:Sulfatase N-terminal domain-containing protein n=2 Tax=Emiliania huxleyi TaxID=2903 RepID=A0A0D3HY98_EMIH1|nr:hypothetical protein EMIHUDRAFT_250748 [Emiliania huxleyi CCMP1516]EOD03983.1 hypothetical protein EMIHUDRAFT_250748 [Emiliania huxleyi CCMP1516]|eukprot:XP_005756412.1 hypothetical protein EMIHUDRAFT_250748 [Emiliania huxleyi CCMP1516]